MVGYAGIWLVDFGRCVCASRSPSLCVVRGGRESDKEGSAGVGILALRSSPHRGEKHKSEIIHELHDSWRIPLEQSSDAYRMLTQANRAEISPVGVCLARAHLAKESFKLEADSCDLHFNVLAGALGIVCSFQRVP